MTDQATGHQRAVDELKEIQSLAAGQPALLRLEGNRAGPDGWRQVEVSLDCSDMQEGPGGQRLAEREHAVLMIPASFPFSAPVVKVRHDRFAGLPYVLGGRQICLYHSDADWNPADGMFGVIARLAAWYERAAGGRLIEAGQPLHPPLAYPESGAADCVVIRPDLPRDFEPAGAVMVSPYPRRADVVEWLPPAALDLDDEAGLARLRARLEDAARAHRAPAFLGAVVVLHGPLSFEFPDNFADLAAALAFQGVRQDDLMRQLAHVWLANEVAAVGRDFPAPLHVVLGAPMRGRAGADTLDTHLEVWQLDPDMAVIPNILTQAGARDAELPAWLPAAGRQAREWIRTAALTWAFTEEARPQIVTRRDSGRPAQWLLGKNVTVLGCGAIGARIAEHCLRAGVRRLVVADRGPVRPGILTRQPYHDADIGWGKARQLARRLSLIRSAGVEVRAETGDIRNTILGTGARQPADLIVDATASRGVSARIEWLRLTEPGRWPPVLTVGVGHTCERAVGALALPHASGAGTDILQSLADQAASSEELRDAYEDFFADPGPGDIFQPEIGCSEPTFTGSDAEVAAAAGLVLTWALHVLNDYAAHRPVSPKSLFLARLPGDPRRSAHMYLDWPNDVTADDPPSGYQLRIRPRAMAQLRVEALMTARQFPPQWETGGVLIGYFDDACQVIWVTAAEGPSPDSERGACSFRHGTEGVAGRVQAHQAASGGRVRFVGLWHTHPGTPPRASQADDQAMRDLLVSLPDTPVPRRAARLILGGGADRWDHWLQGAGPPDIGFQLFSRSQLMAADEHPEEEHP
ncbi:MAG TPA: ThiF family adenylyltransferase [Streptosporangiaceae bacterium]|nr:ThiF family adenylyltransferase [Streptosporangiaceae bacterium]